MTTINPEDLFTLATIKDRDSLQLVGRVLDAQRTMLEAQLVQTRQLQDAVQGRLETMK
jgi:hypothetical protein